MKKSTNLIFNILWWICGGCVMLFGQITMGIFLCITLVGIPLGIKYFKIVPYVIKPFGKVVVTRFRKKAGLNFLNLFFGGFASFIIYKIYSIFLYCTIFLIPFAKVINSLAKYNIAPWGTEIVKEGQFSSHGLSNYDFDLTLRRFIFNQNEVISLKTKTNIYAKDLLKKTYFEDKRVVKNIRGIRFPKKTVIAFGCLPIGAVIGCLVYMICIFPVSQNMFEQSFGVIFGMFAGVGAMSGGVPLVLTLLVYSISSLISLILRRIRLKSFTKKEFSNLRHIYTNEKYPNFEIELFSKSGFKQVLKAYKSLDKEYNIPKSFLEKRTIDDLYELTVNQAYPTVEYAIPVIEEVNAKKPVNVAARGSTIVSVILFIWGLVPVAMCLAATIELLTVYGTPIENYDSYDHITELITGAFLDIVGIMIYFAVISISVYFLISGIKYKDKYKKKKGVILPIVDMSFAAIFAITCGICSYSFNLKLQGDETFPTQEIEKVKQKYNIDYDIPFPEIAGYKYFYFHEVNSDKDQYEFDNFYIDILNGDDSIVDELKNMFLTPTFIKSVYKNEYVSFDYKLKVSFGTNRLNYYFSLEPMSNGLITDRIDVNFINYTYLVTDREDYIGKFDYSILEVDEFASYSTNYNKSNDTFKIKFTKKEDFDSSVVFPTIYENAENLNYSVNQVNENQNENQLEIQNDYIKIVFELSYSSYSAEISFIK